MSLLVKNSTPAERSRGCLFAERFESVEKVIENNGTISGAPSIDFGITLDGTNDYVTYNLSGTEFNCAEISQVIEFWPHFDYDNDALQYLVSGNDCGDVAICKKDNANSNKLSITLGGTLVADISISAYSWYWFANERNVLVVSGTTGDTDVWLNGKLVLDSDPTAWTPTVVSALYMGSLAGGSKFDGKITQYKVFRSLVTQQEAIDYYIAEPPETVMI